MKKMLTETYITSFNESEEKPKGVLKVITGCVADFKENRNRRVYPRKLWENVLKSEYVKEMMENHMLLGEADHPEERTDISLQMVSHCINKMWIDEDKQELWAELHILPTPLGELVANLVEYGSKIGVSSRGAGSVGSDGMVDADDYQFFTFDLVARPSVAAARPAIVESEQVDIKELSDDDIRSILEQYHSLHKENDTCPIDIYEMEKDSLIETAVSGLVLNSKMLNELEDSKRV